MVRKYVSLLPNEGVKYIKLLVVIVNLLEIMLHWDEMANGPCGQWPPRLRPKWPTAISSGPKLPSWPFQTNDITWAPTSNPVSDG